MRQSPRAREAILRAQQAEKALREAQDRLSLALTILDDHPLPQEIRAALGLPVKDNA